MPAAKQQDKSCYVDARNPTETNTSPATAATPSRSARSARGNLSPFPRFQKHPLSQESTLPLLHAEIATPSNCPASPSCDRTRSVSAQPAMHVSPWARCCCYPSTYIEEGGVLAACDHVVGSFFM
ncbi:hypothetical protein PG997_000241 [Apiospora hydei]|uniref:Uncharacterized protein n=1 Tax=Apiospora hydei TaxID=1337664 RepID=A0ABR1XA79_9PEZI